MIKGIAFTREKQDRKGFLEKWDMKWFTKKGDGTF